MTDRPSRRPTRKIVRPEPPRIPPAPGVPNMVTAERDAPRKPAAAEEAVEPPPHSTGPPPAMFSELRRLSGHPSPLSPREDVPRIDSGSFTLPSPYAIPALLVEIEDLDWFGVDPDIGTLVALIDGRRTISQIAEEGGVAPGHVQVRIADLRDRGLVALA